MSIIVQMFYLGNVSGSGPMATIRVVLFGHEIIHKVVHFGYFSLLILLVRVGSASAQLPHVIAQVKLVKKGHELHGDDDGGVVRVAEKPVGDDDTSLSFRRRRRDDENGGANELTIIPR